MPLRVVANENMPGTVIRALRDLGHDVLSVKESMRGEADERILARAQAEQRLVVTQDKDFGELAFHARLPATCGVVLFRLTGADPDADNRRILQTLAGPTVWVGHFAVVTESRIRIRPLPPHKKP